MNKKNGSEETSTSNGDGDCNGLEIKEIAERVFSEPPKPQNSISLNLDLKSSDLAREKGVEQSICEILSLFVTYGICVKYGPEFKIQNATLEQFYEINLYVQSVGFNLNMEYGYTLANGEKEFLDYRLDLLEQARDFKIFSGYRFYFDPLIN